MAARILSELQAAGLTLTAVDGRLIVEPAGRITDEHRALIRAHKSELLESLKTLDSTEPAAVGFCGLCRHIRRPGIANRYCAGRDDLPPAYGLGHPLRQLPADQGVTCSRWEAQ